MSWLYHQFSSVLPEKRGTRSLYASAESECRRARDEQIRGDFLTVSRSDRKSHNSCVKTRQFRATISANDRQGYRNVKSFPPGGLRKPVIPQLGIFNPGVARPVAFDRPEQCRRRPSLFEVLAM
jgi:hypothetical protein